MTNLTKQIISFNKIMSEGFEKNVSSGWLKAVKRDTLGIYLESCRKMEALCN